MADLRQKNRSFSVFTGALLSLLVLYILVILVNVAFFTDVSILGREGNLGRILTTVKVSILCATGAAVAAFLFAAPASYVLARRSFRGKSFLDTVLDVPTILSPVALGTALLLFFGRGPGQWIEGLFGHITYALPGIVLAQFTVVVALGVRSMKAAFEDVDPRQEDVAIFLGASRWRMFFRVTLPMARGGLLASFLLMWARAVGEFGVTITLAGAIPGKTETIPSAIYLGLAGANVEESLFFVLVLIGVSMTVLAGIRMVSEKRIGRASS
ncbi:MAG: molybdate ABC transporter permease subunit [Planctomycetota bacterium]|jgi:molybdate transport system permease protein